MNIFNALRTLSGYPLSTDTYTMAIMVAGLNADEEATTEVMNSKAFRHATAIVYRTLSEAPNVSQGGVSYTFSEDDRKRLANRAAQILILNSLGKDAADELGVNFGYQGEDL